MILLASASPRRRQLLSLITDDYRSIAVDIDERTDIAEPGARTVYLAEKKAKAAHALHPGGFILAADTLVYVEGEILGKPKDKEDATRMIRMLSGCTHQVYTGVCLLKEEQIQKEYAVTRVCFAELGSSEIEQYVQAEEILDKAGAYGIQSGASKFIEGIEGCFFNVMGLPVQRVYQMLKQF